MKFFDTNALIELCDSDFSEGFYISSITLCELENIKTSQNKDEQTKYKTRQILHRLNENLNYQVVIFNEFIGKILDEERLPHTPDNEICACAAYLKELGKDITFVTGDLNCKIIARDIFKLPVADIYEKKEHYTGFLEVELNDEGMAEFYGNLTINKFNLLTNQYLIIKNTNGEIVDKLKWNGIEYTNIKIPNTESSFFGNIKPYKGDIYQQLALNSFATNQLTMVKGAAGTGKSYLALGYLMSLVEKHKIEKIVVFCNPLATKNAAKLGYLPGSRYEKLKEANIGVMLSSKLGSSYGLEQLVAQGKIELLPMSDIRGYDTTGMKTGIFITEAQNMDIALMKLALQRIGEDSICIIDGDCDAQIDLPAFEGNRNGMKRLSEVFRGHDLYGEVELQNIYRSRIASIAQEM